MGHREADVMGEVTPEQVNGLVNAWLWAADTVATYGPGLAAAGIAWAGWWTRRRAADWRDRRREQRGIRRLEHYANHPAHRTRKETDQP
jgi:hypothetical protein